MNVIEIQSFSDPALDVYARLTENQLVNRADPENALFIAESPNVIHRALDAGCEPVSMLLERKHVEGQAKEIIARCGEIPIYTSGLEVLTQLTGFPLTRGVLCAMRRPKLPAPEEILRNARRIAVLENIMNPTNLGAIFRSAAALNMDAILLTPACTDALYRRCVRVSMGTVFQIPWTYLEGPWRHHRRLRLHREDPHVPRRRFSERGRRLRGSLLPIRKTHSITSPACRGGGPPP